MTQIESPGCENSKIESWNEKPRVREKLQIGEIGLCVWNCCMGKGRGGGVWVKGGGGQCSVMVKEGSL